MQEMGVIRQIDHFLVRTGAPAEVLDFFTKTLGLPMAWPVANYGTFVSGGIHVGSCNLEPVAFGKPDGDVRCVFYGIAFEPIATAAEAAAELDRRGITRGELQENPRRWTNVAIPGVSTPATYHFICHYQHDVQARRASLLKQLEDAGGGILGVRRLLAIVMHAQDLQRERKRWAALLQPTPEVAVGKWSLDAGPELHLVPGEPHGAIRNVLFQVHSLGHAARSLDEREIRYECEGSELRIDPSSVFGLDLRFVVES